MLLYSYIATTIILIESIGKDHGVNQTLGEQVDVSHETVRKIEVVEEILVVNLAISSTIKWD
jgi:hypothetical protein